MANKSLFNQVKKTGRSFPRTTTVNEAGGTAYGFDPKHALAQLAATGTLADTYYTNANDQLKAVIDIAGKIESDTYLAKCAVFARERGFMKDMPALLSVILSTRDTNLLRKVFPRVIDNGKMVRNFVQIVRSGLAGRKSLGSAPKNLINEWIRGRTPEQLIFASIGNDPSLIDVIKLTHPKPLNREQDELIKYLMGREHTKRYLPSVVKQYEAFKNGDSDDVPKVPFEMLAGLEGIGKKGWTAMAKNGGWQFLRMNLNNFQKHGVFEDQKMVKYIANRIKDSDEIKKAKVFPYQLMMAYKACVGVPNEITEALQDALDVALENIPEIQGNVWIFPDVSGSMSNAGVTGFRGTATSDVRCIEVAGLIAAAFLRSNKNAKVIPFEGQVVNITLNPRDSVMTNAQKLGAIGGGSTNCSAPMHLLNKLGSKGDLIIYVSDNQSWVDNATYGRATATMAEWQKFKQRNPKAKMVCIDLEANSSTQAPDAGGEILNIGGFSDVVFDVVADFANEKVRRGKEEPSNWVEVIEAIKL